MRNRLLHFFGVESGEESMVSLLLTQSVFLGLFYGAFDISAHSLFLAVFDETIMARAYVFSGFAGIILTSLYSFLQARMQFKNFAVVNLMMVTTLTLVLWLLLMIYPNRSVIFLVFVMMGPLNILAMLGFWGTTGRLFTLRQGKRLFGLVDAGQILGIIISSYAIPVLLTFGFNTHNIILVSAVAIAIASGLQYSTGKNHVLGDTAGKRKGSVKIALGLFRKNRYVLNMGLFISLSVMTAFFVQYSFMAVTREQYPLEADMARFLGLFIGSMMIFTLFLKTFLFSYLIRNYGLKVILLLLPLLLMVFTAGAAMIGTTMGYVPATGGFMIFFLILALSRLFSKSLKDSIENPSFKVIYQTLGEKVRYDVQSIVDGTVNEIAALASGILLSGLGIIVMGKLIHFSWVLLAITLLWAYFGYRLYAEYRKAIVRSLNEATEIYGDEKDVASPGGYGNFHAKIVIRYNYLKLIAGDFSLLQGPMRSRLAHVLITLAGESFDKDLIPVLKWIAADGDFSSELKGKARDAIETIEGDNANYLDPFFNTSVQPETRALILSARTPQPMEVLSLLRHSAPAEKRSAIVAIGKHRINELLPEVCEHLGRGDVAIDASSVIKYIGTDTYGELSRNFMRSSGNVPLLKTILHLMGEICFDEAENLIYQMLRANSRTIRDKAVKILVENGYQIRDSEKDKIHQLISEVVGIITWYIQASVTLAKTENNSLIEAVKKEKLWWDGFLFDLLAITYDPQYIGKIRENLSIGTVESVNFALEMIDIVVDESVKDRISLCVDINDDDEKLRSLNQYYPGYVPQYEDLIIEVINRDYNLTGLYTKAIAIGSLNEDTEIDNYQLTLSALLFSPNQILVEEATRIAIRKENGIPEDVFRRLPETNRGIITRIMKGLMPLEELLVTKVDYLHKLTVSVPEDDLIPLAQAMKYLPADEVEVVSAEDVYLFPVETGVAEFRGRLVRSGSKLRGEEDLFPQACYSVRVDSFIEYTAFNRDHLDSIAILTDTI